MTFGRGKVVFRLSYHISQLVKITFTSNSEKRLKATLRATLCKEQLSCFTFMPVHIGECER